MTLGYGTHGRLAMGKPLVNPQSQGDPRRKPLAEIAQEMQTILPGLLLTRPDAEPRGKLYKTGDAPRLDINYCPKLPPTSIRVVPDDTIDAATRLAATSPGSKRPVCILNMANAKSAGGGWKHGALAQEEAICYRTSLSCSLKHGFYPLPETGGIFSPRILVIRENMKDGHKLVDLREPKNLPLLSVVSVAAVCLPRTQPDNQGRQRYVSGADARLMEEKMRVILRIAVRNGHRQIVLGAFGCGAFGNPREEVARMWRSVFADSEFSGGWWQDVVFAVMDDQRGPNFLAFQKVLDGLKV